MKTVAAACLPFALLFLLPGCSGDSSDSGMLIEGTLTEAGGAGHGKSLLLKHSDGQRIEDVQVCALGECSTTDGEGQWGFVAGEGFPGGDVLFTVNGHGIKTATAVNISGGAKEVFLDLRHVEGGLVEATHVTVDGETEDNHGEEVAHHDEGEEQAHE
jgi:hypothetical protein